jgi:hypothetical protein
VAGPVVKTGLTSTVAYSHYSFNATLEANWGLTPINANDASAPNMMEVFQ